MKRISTLICLAVFFSLTSCNKGNPRINASIQGSWELKRKSGMLTIDYPPGNGQVMKFTGSNYEIITNGRVTKTGNFEIVEDPAVAAATCLVVPESQYRDRNYL